MLRNTLERAILTNSAHSFWSSPAHQDKADETPTNTSEDSSGDSDPLSDPARYHMKWRLPAWDQKWLDVETEELIAKAYARHRDFHHLDDDRVPLSPRPSVEELESLTEFGKSVSYKAEKWQDKLALGLVNMAKPVVHLVFKSRYLAHAVSLEVVAAVPGMVAGAMRHIRSLRKMDRDHGWVPELLEEAENERAHLLMLMQVIQPSRLERYFVLTAQLFYLAAYTTMYTVSPRTAHSFVAYLEEEAARSYAHLVEQIDAGEQENPPAPKFARKYYSLDTDARLRDMVLHILGDECMHATTNRRMAEILDKPSGSSQALDVPPFYPSSIGLPDDHPESVAVRESRRASSSTTSSSP